MFEQYTSFSEQMFSKKNDISLAKFNGNRLMELINNILTHNQIHIVIGQMWGWTIDYNILQKIRILGIPVVNISMDDRHAFRLEKNSGKWLGTSGLIGVIDLACTAAKECCLWYQVEGCPAIYLPEASDSELYKPFAVNKEYDVCFVGANYGIRSKIVKAIGKKGIRVTCYGKGWPHGRLDAKELPVVFAKSRIVLGVGTIGHCTDFFSLKMRDFDGPMSGSFYLTHDNPDLYELYDIGREIATYRTPEECANKVSYYLSRHSERESIAMAGRARAMKNHTWEKRFDKLFRTIGIIE
ncbi:MAG: glycosyltransferase [Planctomycetes bacterium]|nr:glycosyltransferase [Planctomycetota bacterium]